MKKILMMFAVVTLLLVGCSSDKDAGGSDSGDKKASASGSDYPKKPIKFIIPFSPGGDTDANGRIVAKYLQKELGQNVVPTNVTGSAGSVATEEASRSKTDGYTILWHHNAFLINEITGVAQKGYGDFESLGIPIIDQTNLFAVSADSDIESLEDLVQKAKDNPGKLNAASGIGNYSHYLYEDFIEKAGVDINLVDAGGGNEQRAALLAGRVDILYSTYQQVQGEIESGDFRVLGFMSEERHPQAQDIPTFKEQGVDMVDDKFFTIQAPKGTPQEIIDRISDAMEKIKDDPEYNEELKRLFVSPDYISPTDSVDFIENEYSKYEKYKDQLKGQ
ncbi:tripartite tricarboxylate transporter substrate binding protein [Sporosarcina cascadiensis]|uniref:tripartite tricarboxylate transporter substrate binding protein n=1 Tax=Sporosarcina cascadiensis TaxID=2660747 RepID=UPI00129BC1CD|nr:tripartite tricarboxylate transporter substrate binding protein [Sporosarcina cascadiensis]